MSIPPLDQVLSLVAPASNPNEPSRASSGEETRFQNHLQRASESEAPRETPVSKPSETTASAARSQNKDAEKDSSQAGDDRRKAVESTAVQETDKGPEEEVVETGGEATIDEVVVSDAAAEIVDATLVQPQFVEPSLESSEQPQQSGEVEVPATPERGFQSGGDELAQVPTAINALEGESEKSVTEPELLATQLGEGDGREESANSETEETRVQTKVQGDTKTPADSTQQIEPAQKQDASSAAVPLDRQAKEDGGTTPLTNSQGSQESTTPRQFLEKQNEAEPTINPRAATENNIDKSAANATQAESEIANKAVPTNSETIAPANHSETDASQRPNGTPPLRSLERVLGGGPVRSESSTSQTETTSPVDRARFVQRVGNAFRTAQQRDGHVQLRLSPPELGSLKIDISVRQGILTASLETESVAARNVLLDNLPALRERLAEQDIRIEQFDVDVRRDGQQAEDRSQDSRRSDNPSSESRSQRGRETESEEAETSAEVALGIPAAITQEGLDVRI